MKQLTLLGLNERGDTTRIVLSHLESAVFETVRRSSQWERVPTKHIQAAMRLQKRGLVVVHPASNLAAGYRIMISTLGARAETEVEE